MITGASSGIGRATALEFARRGVPVVVAARRDEPLQTLAVECERAGAAALAVSTDVTDPAAVEELARLAVERFGSVDVWVNNAGVHAIGRFDEIPPDAFRRVLEVNFFGTVHGARTALRHFRERGRGVLVNNASVDGHVAAPYTAPYVASKWAVRGFSESLRQELRDTPGVHVAVVSPAAIDTPFFQHAANYSGRALKALTPTYEPEKVARAIVGLAERPQREVIVGGAGKLIALQRRLSPALADRAFALQMQVDHFDDAPAGRTDGNLFEPLPQWTETRGGWQRVGRGTRRAAMATGAALAAAGAAAAALRHRD